MSLPRIPREDARVLVFLSLLSVVVFAIVCLLMPMCGGEHDNGELKVSELKNLPSVGRGFEEDSVSDSQYWETHLAEKLFVFDPNHADSLTLRKIGLSGWQIRNMMRYRQKGGKWRSPDDFARLYGLEEADFRRLRPYIRIAEADKRSKFVPFEKFESYKDVNPMPERPQYEHKDRLQEGEVLSINTADTTQLKRIPGIGSYYAKKIVSYRERMGGFVSVRQIEEIEGLPAGISRWFILDNENAVKKIRINKASFSQLVRHPYLNYDQVKDIVNHIRQYGPLKSWRDLRLYKEFTDKDFARLSPYFSFD